VSSRAGMQIIRPAEAFNLARDTQNFVYFVYFASFLNKNTLRMCENKSWISQKKILARHEISVAKIAIKTPHFCIF